MGFHRSRPGTSRRPSWAQPLCMEPKLCGEGRGAWRMPFRGVSTACQRRFFPYPLSGMRVFSLQGRKVQVSKVQVFNIQACNIQVCNIQVRNIQVRTGPKDANRQPGPTANVGPPGPLPPLSAALSQLAVLPHTPLRGCLLAHLFIIGAFTLEFDVVPTACTAPSLVLLAPLASREEFCL